MPFSPDSLSWRFRNEQVLITCHGPDVLRVRASDLPEGLLSTLPSALIDDELVRAPVLSTEPPPSGGCVLENGALGLRVDGQGRLTFFNRADGGVLLEENAPVQDSARAYRRVGSSHRVAASFRAWEGERLHGLGQHPHGLYDQKGAVIPLEQRNTQVSVPLLLSSRGYAVLWNLPAVGRVELGANGTRWVAKNAPRIDYLVWTGRTPADLLKTYARLTGLPRRLPEWAFGFWQSKLRYESQAEVLAVAREFHRRKIPLDVLVIDYFHWTKMGEWRFDPVVWPDPAAMVAELRELGIRPMVSVWPTLNPQADSFDRFRDRGHLVTIEGGGFGVASMVDTTGEAFVPLAVYDASHPGAREAVWAAVRDNYLAHGIDAFWLDACEPEFSPYQHERLRYEAGPGDAVGCAYPRWHQQTFHDGLVAEGREDVVLLSRSAWAGSQRLGAVVWSGDIQSTFESLARQVRAGLNMALSGIPWWNTDIGGFHGGDPQDPAFQELLIRWFQYGLFCPVCRLHGHRMPGTMKSGAPNEPWAFGPFAEKILVRLIRLRHALKPYLLAQAEVTVRTGLPLMRPLWLEFPEDVEAAAVSDQFMLGADLLVAPVCEAGATGRVVYLPAGRDWFDVNTGEWRRGGVSVKVGCGLDEIPAHTCSPTLVRLFGAPSREGALNVRTPVPAPSVRG